MSRILFILNFAAALALTANYAAVAQTTMLFKAGKGLALDDVSPQFVRLDTVFLRVEYTAHTTTDTAANSVGREKMLLEIGEHYTKFYSALYEEICYVLENYSNRQALSNASHGLDPSSWYSYVYEAYYVDLAKGEAVSTGRIGSLDFKYQEKVPAIEWSIEDSLKTIGEYTAQKATCRFRGRDYVAWFTSEIPLPYGPWKFHGLPGLILSVSDTRKFPFFKSQTFHFHSSPVSTILPRYHLPSSPKIGEVAVRPEGYDINNVPTAFLFPPLRM